MMPQNLSSFQVKKGHFALFQTKMSHIFTILTTHLHQEAHHWLYTVWSICSCCPSVPAKVIWGSTPQLSPLEVTWMPRISPPRNSPDRFVNLLWFLALAKTNNKDKTRYTISNERFGLNGVLFCIASQTGLLNQRRECKLTVSSLDPLGLLIDVR